MAAAESAGRGGDRGRGTGPSRAVRRGERGDDTAARWCASGWPQLWSLARSVPPGRHSRVGAGRGDHRTVSVVARARVQLLAEHVADQIAAGEVVERPASVVKELVENALDAGAHAVRVELEDGGKTLIRVSDDGSGMDREDARLALQRHATSKIRTATDLIGVATFGFRGEALPAIASVSRFELETTGDGEAGATRLRVTGGKLEGEDASARQRGTTVTVRGLFYNTPARRKFLRATATETRAAVEALTVLALTRPDVAFSLTSDGRVLLDCSPATRLIDRVHALWGAELADTLLAVSHRAGPLEVTGLAQRPAQARPAGRKGYVFVRGRPVRDPFILRAAEAGYRSTIAPGDRPSLLLFLDLPGDAVDVNVHPAKLEARFRDKFFVERVVEEAVREALAPLESAAPIGGVGFQVSGAWFQREGSVQPTAGVPLELFRAESLTPDTRHQTPLLQVFDTYILFQTDSGVAIVDQHSAHERVLYEDVMRQLSGDGAPAQRLLLPLTLDFAPAELDAIEAHRELLARIGYEIEPFSGRSIVVHTAPNPHPRFEAARCLQELVADLAGGRFGGWQNRLERFAATYACRAAIKAGQTLDADEMRQLIVRLLSATLPAHDVHGRPSMVQLPKEELERRFGRSTS
ncbi:MAG: DNA mismatch repair endonuclease MutL [Gemmatimonadetes bacterium]|nr:MAG: DNA mismatch repair endonuclease MutL [Gemmatimonadota bacterium]